MRISIDAHTLGCRQTGNEVYIHSIINELKRLTSSISCDLFCGSQAGYSAVPQEFTRLAVSKNPIRRLGWDLPRWVHRRRPDVLHVQYTAPIQVSAPVVATVHDVSFLEHPGFFHPLRAAQLRQTVARTVTKAARVITPSEFSRQAVLKHYALDPAKVVTIPNGVSDKFRPMDRDVSRRWIAQKYGIRAPFVLAVGNVEIRKNPMGLLRAFETLVRERPGLSHHLVFAGKEAWKGGEVRRAAARSTIADRVHFTGYVPGDDLAELYAACQLFVFPSFYEGFGLPILEAMACGRAVACSNTTSMPEVAGETAAHYFDPYSHSEMVSAIAHLLTDDVSRRRLERAGIERARGFSWACSASMTLDVYRSVVYGDHLKRAQVNQHEDRALLSASTR
jgi:glycosyltransferase involved in cell wall biosynthesis